MTKKIEHRDYEIICNYDRGWDIVPGNKDEEEIFDAVMELLENSEMRNLG